MTSPVPGALAWPVLALIAAVVAGRWWLLRESNIDRLINRAILAALIGLLLREGTVEQLLAEVFRAADRVEVVNLARQLSFGAILLTVAYIYGIAKLWAGTEPAGTWQRQRGYILVAVAATLVMLLAGTPARHDGLLIDQAHGRASVIAWTAFYLPVLVTAQLVGRVTIRELRSTDETTSWRERLLNLGVLAIVCAIAIDAAATPVLTTVEVIRHVPSPDPNMVIKAWTFFGAAVSAGTVVAVPLIQTALAATGWDRTGRWCRRLHPLWRDLTAAVPEIVLTPPDDRGPIEPAARLHRMIIEIRDSLLHLHHYMPDTEHDDHDRPAGDSRHYAARVARAMDAKTRGLPPITGPTTSTHTRHAIRPGTHDLTAELTQLLDLATLWPKARVRLATTRADAIEPRL